MKPAFLGIFVVVNAYCVLHPSGDDLVQALNMMAALFGSFVLGALSTVGGR